MILDCVHERLMPTLKVKDVTFHTGQGAKLIGHLEDGTPHECIDFFTDAGTASLGYNSPQYRAVLETAYTQRIPAHAPNLARFAERDRAADRLCKLADMERVFFCNSGTEAVETAIKLARKHQASLGLKRTFVISHAGGFHGRTYASMAASDGPDYHYDGYGSLPAGFGHFDTISDLVEKAHGAAAVLLSPVYCNNDIRPLGEDFLEEVAEVCRDSGALLIYDEVQTGTGRTGAPTYGQGSGILPDIVAMAKGIGMGYPSAAVLARGKVAEAFTPGSHFSTFGGGPLACLFINAMIDWLEDERNLKDVRAKGRYIDITLQDMGWPGDPRHVGMLGAFDIDINGAEWARRCLENGLVVGVFHEGPGPVRVVPPLNVTYAELDAGFEIMDQTYKEMK